MDNEKKNDDLKEEELKGNETISETVNEEKEIASEQPSSEKEVVPEQSDEEKETIPEQLDDDDFEKEKEQAKKEKKEKKKKKSEEIEYDENGNPVAKKKKGKLKIVAVIILLVIIAVGGTIAYLVINPNNEVNFFSKLMIESLIKDYAIYINNEEWENVDDCVDVNGFAAFYLIYFEDYSEEYFNYYYSLYGYDEEFEIEDKLSYMDFDKILADLETYCAKVEEDLADYELSGLYDDLMDLVNYENEGNVVSGYELLAESDYAISDVEIDNIKNISRVEGTESLYVATVVYSYANSDSITENLYISRVDGKYKIVGGDTALGFIQYNAYYYGTDAE